MAFCTLTSAKAQNYVTIPDANFVSYLTANFSSAMKGNQMDTSHISVTSLTTMNVENLGIADLTGVQYFSSLQKLDCGNGWLTNTPNKLTSLPKLPPNLDTLICGDNKITLLPSLPAKLRYLSCYMNSLSDLPNLPTSLLYLNCNDNNLANLPILPDNLHFVSCNENIITKLPDLPSGLDTLLCSGNLNLNSLPMLPNSLILLECANDNLDSLPSLPYSLQTIICTLNKLTKLPSLPNSLIAIWCNENQLTQLPKLPSSLKQLYCSNNQLSNLPELPQNSFLWLDCSNNKLSNLPSLPKYLVYLICSNNNITCFPLFPKTIMKGSFNIENNPFTCLPNYIPAMSSEILNYPLCFNGDTLNNKNVCPNAENGILGFVYKDNNDDCLKEISDLNMKNVSVKLFDNNNTFISQTYSAINGIYDFPIDTGNYKIVVDTIGMPFKMQCKNGIDSSITLNTSNPFVDSVNFGFSCKDGYDIGTQNIRVWGIPFPGLQHGLQIVAGDMSNWYNLHCAAGTSGQVKIMVNGAVTFNGIMDGTLTPTIANNVYTYIIDDFGTLKNWKAFGLLFTTNETAQAGDEICAHVSVTPVIGDNVPSNNNYDFCYLVVNSHDPNSKEVYPVNVEPNYTDYFTYTVHFQNTGTAAAQNIRVVDTLSSFLDLNSFQLISYSNNNITTLDSNIITVRFPNIQLPDSTSNPEGSVGYFQYRIKPKAKLSSTTEIKNTAHIYFDYNSPIATNTTTNKFNAIKSSTKQINDDRTITIYPNPTTSSFAITGITEAQIEVYNLQKQLILNKKINGKESISLNNIPSGIYFVTIITSNKTTTQSLIVK